jgi:hypothetical protein
MKKGSEKAPPEGFRYQADVLPADEERKLVERIRELPLKEFEFHGYVGKRRVMSYGWHYDFGERKLREADEIPAFLIPLRDGAAAFAGLAPGDLPHALVTEYGPRRRHRLAQGQGRLRRRDRHLAALALRVSAAAQGGVEVGALLADGGAAVRVPAPRAFAHGVGAQHPRRGLPSLLHHLPQPQGGRLTAIPPATFPLRTGRLRSPGPLPWRAAPPSESVRMHPGP